MERYIDGLDVSPRYRKVVEKYSDDLKNFIGMRCGLPVFSGTQGVTNPTTKGLVGYGQYIQLGQCLVSMGSGRLCRRVGIQNELTGIDEFLKRERERKVIDMGRAGVGGGRYLRVLLAEHWSGLTLIRRSACQEWWRESLLVD